MKFEDYAREASRALSVSGRSVDVPSVTEMWARRRRRGLVLGSTSVAILAAGTVALVATLGGFDVNDRVPGNGSESRVSVPAATIPVEGGGVLFGPPRIEGADTVQFPITLLDGTRLSLTLPQSLAGDIQGLVPGGAASWRLDPCCGRTLDVIYGAVDDLYGDRQPDVEYEDADGNPVGFFTEEDDVDYLVFQYGSWVVRAWDGGPGPGERFSEENRAMFASLMRGYETAEGFLVLDPAEPMSIGPTDAPDATLTTSTGDGSVGVFTWRDCASEGPSANPDVVTSNGYLVSFPESSGMTSICFPKSSLYLLVSRIDLTEAELEAINLTYATDEPSDESSTTTLESLDGATTTPIPLEEPVSLRVLAVRPNNPSLAVIDLWERTTTIYPPGVHALPRDATDGAVMTPARDLIIWTQGVARLISGSLDHVDMELGPHPPRSISGLAPALRAIPTPQADHVWLVQPGVGWGTNDYPTLVELVSVEGGESILSVELDPNAFPVAASETGLILNTHRWLDTGDGFVTEPGTEFALHMLDDGTTVPIGEGRAIAASPTRVARITSDRLLISAPDGSSEIEVAKTFVGTWIDIGGPMIPSDAMPLQTVSSDGAEMLISLGRDHDVNVTPAYSELIAVSLTDGSTRTIAKFEGGTPLATWSSDGEWMALLWQRDITLINSADPQIVIQLQDVVPQDHWPLAAG